MKEKITLTREKLPDTLDPIHIQQFLQIGRKQVYELLQKPPFHICRVGRLIKVSKESFLRWFDGDSQYEIVQHDKSGNVVKMKWNDRIYTLQYH